jgi:hypothetical protein
MIDNIVEDAKMDDGGDALRYDKLLLTQLNKIRDQMTKFALQNYAASGAILLAYFATKVPLWAVFVAILVVNVNFILALASNNWQIKALYAAHKIARDAWFADEPKAQLLEQLKTDEQSNQLFTGRDRKKQFDFDHLKQQLDFNHLAIVSNLLPSLAACVLVVMRLSGVSLR